MSLISAINRDAARERLNLLGWAVVLAVLAYVGLVLAVAMVVIGGMIWLGLLVPVFTAVVTGIRQFADMHRRWAARLLGTEIPRPYRPDPDGGALTRFLGMVRDPATWRDLAWLLVNATLGFLLTLLAVAVAASAVAFAVLPLAWPFLPDAATSPDIDPTLGGEWGMIVVTDQASALLASIQAIPMLALTWWATPHLMRANARLAHALLSPSGTTRLTARVDELAETRAETVDAQAAELRRIERDLHDGAQARLVSLGMSLGMAEELLASDPDAAQELLADARRSTGLALSELRDLIRGIHPPVLADRGLDGAVHALALAHPGQVDSAVTLSGRPDAPVESAAYFAVAEALTNVSKHANAARTWVEVRHAEGTLRIVVGDDGPGGAAVEPGGGLHGIQRRLAAFDGSVSVTSPPGGPTVVTMELPCELSSQRISPSSGTA